MLFRSQTVLIWKDMNDGNLLITNTIKTLAKITLPSIQPQKCPRYVRYTLIPGFEHIGKTAKTLCLLIGMYDNNKCLDILCGECDKLDMKNGILVSLTRVSTPRKPSVLSLQNLVRECVYMQSISEDQWYKTERVYIIQGPTNKLLEFTSLSKEELGLP